MGWVYLVIALLALGAAFYFSPKGWRTVSINGLTIVLVLISEIVGAVQEALPDNWAIYGIAAVNLINLYLRRVTTTPVGKQF
jgi:hypothetical protein